MLELLLILANACGDRVRGSQSVAIGSAIFALSLTLLYGFSEKIAIALFFTYWIGELIGWGEPLKAVMYKQKMDITKLENWQVGILKNNAHLAVIFRGFVWALPSSLLLYFIGQHYLSVVVAVAFTSSMWLSAMIARHLSVKGQWAAAETIRGGLLMTFIIGLNLL